MTDPDDFCHHLPRNWHVTGLDSTHDSCYPKTLKKRLLTISNWADIDLSFARQVLNRFGAPLCDFLRADAPDSHLIIDQVERKNLFPVHLDNERRWYRCHSDATCLA